MKPPPSFILSAGKISTPPNFAPKTGREESGVALVITLSMLLITTIIIVAFFSRAVSDLKASASYSASVQSDLLAAGAMDQVVGNFLREIMANSDDKSQTGFSWFEPKISSNKTYPSMVPEVVTTMGEISPHHNNLVKQSLSGKMFFAAGQGTDVASHIPTTTKSSNGRAVDGTRWSLPELLLDATDSNESTPADFTDTQVPDWIYVTSNGGTTTSVPKTDANTPQIVGRYAYNVYDVGGLININVAGNNGALPEAVATKGSLALADLTQIPGFKENNAAIGTLLKWRAPNVNWANTGTSNNPNIDLSSPSLTDYIRVGNTSGWLRNPASAATGNQFLSRRDLIKYAKLNGFENALPFLTHFNIDADAPSFSPDTTVLTLNSAFPSLIESKPDGVNGVIDLARQKEINPACYDNVVKVTADAKTERVPVLHKRFPLSRLAFVATDPASRAAAGSNQTLTQAYFGLVPIDSYTWKYKDLENDEDHIKRLSEIPAGRDPNFFEILKSVIQVGSLGQHKQVIASEDVRDALEPRANRIDEQILRIGAAIIDQADADSYPTCIRFNTGVDSFGEIYGVEDLPYISALRFVAYTKPASATNTKLEQKNILVQPALWNPHNPGRRNMAEGIPENFQIVVQQDGDIVIQGTNAGANIVMPVTPMTGTLKFQWDPSSTIFQQPQGLLSADYPPLIGLKGPFFPVNQAEEHKMFSDWGSKPFASGNAIGFQIAHIDTDPPSRWNTVKYYGPGCAQFCLQYLVNSKPYTYDRIWFNPTKARADKANIAANISDTFYALYQGNEDVLGSTVTGTSPTGRRSEAIYFKADPRSQRFLFMSDFPRFGTLSTTPTTYMWYEGLSPIGWISGTWGTKTSAMQNRAPMWSLDPTTGAVNPNTDNDYPMRLDLGDISVNTPNCSARYFDRDNVIRRGMSGLIPLTTSSGIVKGATLQTTALSAPTPPISNPEQVANRPIVLNRLFRSVGELAYAFRDTPWKNIDFTFAESADTGLLDAFCVYEDQDKSITPLTGGRVNINVCPIPVLSALLRGVSKVSGTSATLDGTITPLSSEEAVKTAKVITNYRKSGAAAIPSEDTPTETSGGNNGPLRSLAELVGRQYQSNAGSAPQFVGFTPKNQSQGTAYDTVLPESRSAAIRALADVSTTRTWNFMIDLISQSGKIRGNSDLAQFNVSSESRWWMFVSIDRFTGKILARSVERVSE